ncbi:hypothetical protein [Streptomyces sp. NPDC059009]|uniref:hypothetical protein n=1 Tax=Streptomyces sp. NPDC059009 TaxID=3346694 RepID=UPI0036A9EF0D
MSATLTINRVRHALAVSVGWGGRPATDPAGLGLPLAVAEELHGAAAAARAPEVAAAAPGTGRPRTGAKRRAPRGRVRG